MYDVSTSIAILTSPLQVAYAQHLTSAACRLRRANGASLLLLNEVNHRWVVVRVAVGPDVALVGTFGYTSILTCILGQEGFVEDLRLPLRHLL